MDMSAISSTDIYVVVVPDQQLYPKQFELQAGRKGRNPDGLIRVTEGLQRTCNLKYGGYIDLLMTKSAAPIFILPIVNIHF
ncbi:hypothetical protein Pcaca05_17330 [Pectobacterium carotovorum subsp. carotovorum]|nr:hypothetical protein Pcaca05_17330 [Pectobacterium carotovorum subsp. carotovorum]